MEAAQNTIPNRPLPSHSGLGVTSFAVGLVLLIAALVAVSVDRYIDEKKPILPAFFNRSDPRNVNFERLETVKRTCFYIVVGGWPVGFLLGLIGVHQSSRKRIFSTAGILVHAALAYWMMLLHLAS